MSSVSAAKPNVEKTLLMLRSLLQRRQYGEAKALARNLQAAYPRRADTNDALGFVLAAADEYGEAVNYARRAIEIEPRNPVYLLNCGRMLLHMSHILDAEPLLEKALAIDPKLFLASWALGSFYEQIGRGDRAIGYFERSLQAAPPAALAAIRLELANCLISEGMTAEAEAQLRQNLAPGPARARSLCSLMGLAKHTVDSPEYREIEAELQRPGLQPEDHSSLLTAKGMMQANSGNYAESFSTILAAKKLQRVPPYDGSFGREVEQRIKVFTADRIARLAKLYGHPSERQVFVVGMPRSGTTLTEQIIGAHSQAGGAGELSTMQMIARAMRNGGSLENLEAAMQARGTGRARMDADYYVAITDFLMPGKPLVVDKMPHNFVCMGEIAILFPKAKFIHCARNPGDTFISAFQNQMNPYHSYSYAPESYGDYYAAYLRLMRHWYEVMPERIFTVQYEKLTSDPRTTIGEMLAFLGLGWEEGCLNFQEKRTTVRTFSRLQVRQAINTGSIGRWKRYEQQLAPLWSRLAGVYSGT